MVKPVRFCVDLRRVRCPLLSPVKMGNSHHSHGVLELGRYLVPVRSVTAARSLHSMDAAHFDTLTRLLARSSRRQVLRLIGGVTLAGLLSSGASDATAKRRKKRHKKRHQVSPPTSPPPVAFCATQPTGTVCGTCQVCSGGACVSAADDTPCGSGGTDRCRSGLCTPPVCAGEADICLTPTATCGDGGSCLRPLGGGASRCGGILGGFTACGCTSHAQCETLGGSGWFCAEKTGANCPCGSGQGFCAPPR